MKKLLIVLNVLLLGILVAAPVRAQDEPPWPDDAAVLVDDELFSPEELDGLLAPIALYPDPLIAQILPAATFVDQIDAAARYVRLYGSAARIDDQPWDVSVRAVAYYPEVLYMMDRKYDWTVALGQAYLNQPDEVMEAIQRLRYRAQEMGNLSSTPQQTVVVEENYISIIPAQPSVIYVPVYDPLLVYWERPYPTYGFITFGVGFSIGVWLNRDCDWRRHRIYYHGWKGRGWIGRARPHVNARSRVYVGDRFANVTVNHRVRRYDTRKYRSVIRRDVQFRRERGGWTPPSDRRERGRETRGTRDGTAPPTSPRDSGAPRRERDRREQPPPAGGGLPPIPSGSRGTVPPPSRPQERREPQKEQREPAVRVSPPAPSSPSPPPVTPPSYRPPERVSQPPAGGAPQPTRPDRGERYRGRDTGVSAPAPSSGYGGYGSRRELPDYRERGQRSREEMQRITPQPTAPVRPAASPPSARPTPAPAPQPGFSGSRPPAPQPVQQQNRPAVRGGDPGRGGQRGEGRRNR
jgi:hypothetical protein